jgi:hypothetical protein
MFGHFPSWIQEYGSEENEGKSEEYSRVGSNPKAEDCLILGKWLPDDMMDKQVLIEIEQFDVNVGYWDLLSLYTIRWEWEREDLEGEAKPLQMKSVKQRTRLTNVVD